MRESQAEAFLSGTQPIDYTPLRAGSDHKSTYSNRSKSQLKKRPVTAGVPGFLGTQGMTFNQDSNNDFRYINNPMQMS